MHFRELSFILFYWTLVSSYYKRMKKIRLNKDWTYLGLTPLSLSSSLALFLLFLRLGITGILLEVSGIAYRIFVFNIVIVLCLLVAAAAKSLQSCLTLCDPIDSSAPGSPVPGILHARTLEWVAISFSNAWKWKVKVKLLSCVWPFQTPWTAAYQAPPSMGFSRQEYWSGLPVPSPLLIG